MNEERDFNSEPVSTNDAPDTSGVSLFTDEGIETSTGTGTYPETSSGATYVATSESDGLSDVGSRPSSVSGEETPQAKAQPEGDELSLDTKKAILEDYVNNALKENFLSLSALQIKSAYPKAYKKLFDYVQSKSPVGLDEETMIATLLYTPRSVLYSFFDEQELFVNTIGKHTSWESILNDETSQASFTSRVYAEFDGFHKAFEELNKK